MDMIPMKQTTASEPVLDKGNIFFSSFLVHFAHHEYGHGCVSVEILSLPFLFVLKYFKSSFLLYSYRWCQKACERKAVRKGGRYEQRYEQILFSPFSLSTNLFLFKYFNINRASKNIHIWSFTISKYSANCFTIKLRINIFISPCPFFYKISKIFFYKMNFTTERPTRILMFIRHGYLYTSDTTFLYFSLFFRAPVTNPEEKFGE